MASLPPPPRCYRSLLFLCPVEAATLCITGFVERRVEMYSVISLLAEHRLVTIRGSAGAL
jgi:hypothetical protein